MTEENGAPRPAASGASAALAAMAVVPVAALNGIKAAFGVPGVAVSPDGLLGPMNLWRAGFSLVWLIYIIEPVSSLVRHPGGALWTAGGIAILVVFCAWYLFLVGGWQTRGVLARLGAGRLPAWAALLPLFALAATACTVYGAMKWNSMWIYVSVSCGLVITDRRTAARGVLATGACFLVFSVIGHVSASDYLVTLLIYMLVGFAMIGFRMRMELMRELAQARETVVRMAASEERLRLARDMHDLTGQSLSTITLKSELAVRLLGRLPDSPERDRARDEVEQVAAVSRQTLHDIREAISGYRKPTLAVEIITARNALESAGITGHDDADLTMLSGSFDPNTEAALAWCLREAVTNVVRHSGARNCRIRLTKHPKTLSLEVADDGQSLDAQPPPQPPPQPSPQPSSPSCPSPGTGLRGMSERLSAAGGQLELYPGADGFRLVASVPLRRAMTTQSATVTA
jgi:two-component system sensor histidine kinase DesK